MSCVLADPFLQILDNNVLMTAWGCNTAIAAAAAAGFCSARFCNILSAANVSNVKCVSYSAAYLCTRIVPRRFDGCWIE